MSSIYRKDCFQMLTNYVKNIQEATPLSETAFCGDVGDMFDRFIENRISSDFAINEILIKEAETVFFDRSDDKDAPLGRWRGEFWGKLIISACRAAWSSSGLTAGFFALLIGKSPLFFSYSFLRC